MSKAKVLLRFGVQARDGRRSSVWRLWRSQSTYGDQRVDDVYLAVRQMASHAKISAHGSGQCQFSFTTNRPPVRFIGTHRPEDRHLVKWTRPTPASPAVLVARIIIPESELRILPEINRPTTWLSGPGKDQYSEIQMWFSTASTEDQRRGLADAGQELVLGEPLTTEQLLLVHRHRPMRADHKEGLAGLRERIRANLPPEELRPGLRGVRYLKDAQRDGSHAFVEIAATD